MYGKGYWLGIGLGLLLWLLIRQVDKRYYRKKHELIQKRLREKEQQQKDRPAECAPKKIN